MTAAALITATGVVMLLAVYLFMRFVPDYRLTGVTAANDAIVNGAGAPPAHVIPEHAVASGIIVTSEADVLRVLLLSCVVALVVLGALGAWASWLMAGRMLRPLDDLARAVENTRGGSLTHRIRRVAPNDELQTLSDAFDDMMDEVQRTLALHQRFAANASHELRTPLATTKAILQVAQGDTNPPHVEELLARLISTNDRLIATTNAMLDLAISGLDSPEMSSTELSSVVREELALLTGELEDRSIQLKVQMAEVCILGNRDLLRLLVGNLLRNAVRHNIQGGFVTVEVSSEARSHVALTIQNSGATVPTDALRGLREPFHRPRGRVAEHPGAGHGLGLALIANVVEAHHAQLQLSPRRAGGMVAVVTFQRPVDVTDVMRFR